MNWIWTLPSFPYTPIFTPLNWLITHTQPFLSPQSITSPPLLPLKPPLIWLKAHHFSSLMPPTSLVQLTLTPILSPYTWLSYADFLSTQYWWTLNSIHHMIIIIIIMPICSWLASPITFSYCNVWSPFSHSAYIFWDHSIAVSHINRDSARSTS